MYQDLKVVVPEDVGCFAYCSLLPVVGITSSEDAYPREIYSRVNFILVDA